MDDRHARRIFDIQGPHEPVIEQLNMPASFVILDRVVWGVSAILGKLDARGPLRAMLLEYIADGEPATDLGAAEAAWRAGHARDYSCLCHRNRRSSPDLVTQTGVGRFSAASSRALETHVDPAAGGTHARAIAVDWALRTARSVDVDDGASQRQAHPCSLSRRHAWHAELWRERSPVIPIPMPMVVSGQRARLGGLVDALVAFDALPSGPGRPAVAGVAAAELAREYRVVAGSIDPLLDAPTAHALDVVIADLEAAPTAAGELADDEHAALDVLHAVAPYLALGVV